MKLAALGVVVWVVGCTAAPAPVVQEIVAKHEHEQDGQGHGHEGHEGHEGEELVRITDPGHVCMLSNRFLGEKPHVAPVPIDVEDKTYFGCCANCAARLGDRADARVAVDPVNGHTLDKAKAILARDATNKVLYFESEETLAQMRRAR